MNKTELLAEFDETWYFLTLSASNAISSIFIDSWSFGKGSIAEYRGAEHRTIESVDEEKSHLKELASLLNEHRFEEVKLITPSEQTIYLLRSRLLSSDLLSQPILRGYPHLPVAELIQRNFDLDGVEYASGYQSLIKSSMEGAVARNEPPVQELWDIMTEIAPLLPAQELEGVSL